MQNNSRNLKAVYENDCSVKLYDVDSGEVVSNLGYYYNEEPEDLIKSVKYNGSNAVYLLDKNVNLIDRIYLNGYYERMNLESVFNPAEMNLV